MESRADLSNENDSEESTPGVRLIVLNLPEDEGEGLGFRLTRTLWDPYPWVREVIPESRAESAGLRTGDCLLQADGKDLLGMPIGQVAGLIRGDGCGRGVSLLCWNCGVDPYDDPELLWSCGGGARGERARRALAGVVRALACCVCAATATTPLSCARGHLYCDACWCRLERCALCRENLPPKDSPYARNLLAEQVFEAIATEYNIKEAKRPRTSSARSPSRSPLSSPAATRKGQYQLSMMAKRRAMYTEKYASDPNIQQSCQRQTVIKSSCLCQSQKKLDVKLTARETTTCSCDVHATPLTVQGSDSCPKAQHKLVTRVRQACSLLDLQNNLQACQLSQSLTNINAHEACSSNNNHSSSVDNLKNTIGSSCEPPIFVLTTPPIYLLTCEHNQA